MTTLVHKKRLNVMETSRPGMVGSVGDAIVTPQLAVSTPGMSVRYDQQFYNRSSNGSLLSPQPYVMDSNWNMGRSENTAYGLRQQDIRAPDRLHEPTNIGVPQYSWYNKLATVYEAKRRGNMFLPLPGPYQLAEGEMLRGSQVVRVTDMEDLRKFGDQDYSPRMFGKDGTVIPAPKIPMENVVSNRPIPNLANKSGAFNVMRS